MAAAYSPLGLAAGQFSVFCVCPKLLLLGSLEEDDSLMHKWQRSTDQVAFVREKAVLDTPQHVDILPHLGARHN